MTHQRKLEKSHGFIVHRYCDRFGRDVQNQVFNCVLYAALPFVLLCRKMYHCNTSDIVFSVKCFQSMFKLCLCRVSIS